MTHYLLVFCDKDDKSSYLKIAGYIPENWSVLERDLIAFAEVSEAFFEGEDQYGPS